MKKKPYLYCPFPQAQFALAVFEVLQALAWIFVGVWLQEFISGKKLWPMVFILFFAVGFFVFRFVAFLQSNVQICFTEEGVCVTQRPAKEHFIPWDSIRYGYATSTNRVEYLVLSQEILTRKQLLRMVRRSSYKIQIIVDNAILIPKHILSGANREISNLEEFFPVHIQFMETPN